MVIYPLGAFICLVNGEATLFRSSLYYDGQYGSFKNFV